MGVPLGHRIILLLRLYDRLKAEPYGKDTQVKLSVSFGGPDGGKTEVNTDPTEWKSYLVLFRQLVSPNDSVYLGDLVRDLGSCIKDRELRLRLACARRAWVNAHHPSLPAVLTLGEYGLPEECTAVRIESTGHRVGDAVEALREDVA